MRIYFILIAAFILPIACGSAATVQPSEQVSNIVEVDRFRSSSVAKYVDADAGVICYIYSGYGISCVKQ